MEIKGLMKAIRTKPGFAVGSILLLGMSPANAAHPASVAGTWFARGNQTTGSLVINQPFAATSCKPITGTIFGNAIEGIYCPAVGRILFVRKLSNGVPSQLYEGSVSQDGVTDFIGGTFKIWSGATAAADGPDYNFSASK